MTTGAFNVQPQAISDTTASVSSILGHTGDLIGELESTVLDGVTFGAFGSDVASANSSLQGQQVDALRQTTNLLDQTRQAIDTSNAAYQQADAEVAAGYGGNATTTTDGSTSTTDLANDPTLRAELARDEGDQTHVYTDTAGHPTIGIGFNLDRSDARQALTSVGANYDAVRAGTQDLTDAQVNQLFSQDAGTAVTTAQSYYAGFDQLDAARQRVLTNMAFNLGASNLGQFQQLHTALTNGDYNAAANAMQDSAWANQVGDRATRLIQQMRSGVDQ